MSDEQRQRVANSLEEQTILLRQANETLIKIHERVATIAAWVIFFVSLVLALLGLGFLAAVFLR